MDKRLLLLALVPAVIQAQTTTTNFYDRDGVFQGAVTSTPYGGYVYGESMQPQGYFTTTTPQPLQPSIPFGFVQPVAPVETPTFGIAPIEPIAPLSLDTPLTTGILDERRR